MCVNAMRMGSVKILGILLSLLSIVACGSAPEIIPVTSVSVMPGELELFVGENAELVALVSPENATDKSLSWSSSDFSVVMVDAYGKVRAIKEGTVSVTARNGKASGKCRINVTAKPENHKLEVPQTTFSLTNGSQQLEVTVKSDLEFIVSVSEGCKAWIKHIKTEGPVTDAKVILRIENNNEDYNGRKGIVSLRQIGSELYSNIFIEQGEAYGLLLTTTEFNLSREMQSVSVEVKSNVEYDVVPEVDWIKNAQTKGLTRSQIYLDIEANKTYEDRTGLVAVKQVGGELVSYITVNQERTPFVPVTSIRLNKSSLSLYPDCVFNLEATIEPGNATDKSIRWSSSETSVATVDDNGLVRPIGIGHTTIMAQSGDATATCSVQVINRPAVSSISLSESFINGYIDRHYDVSVTITPGDASCELEWSVSDSRVAEVQGSIYSADIHTKDFGKTTITARDKSTGVSASVNINTVVTDFRWAEDTSDKYSGYPLITIGLGTKHQLKYSCNPSYATHLFEDLSNFDFYEKSMVSAPTYITLDSEGCVTGVQKGTVGIKPTGNIIKASGTDRLYIKVISEVAESEYNNESSRANSAMYGLPLLFDLSSTSDVDWFKLPLPKGGFTKIRINLTYDKASSLGSKSCGLKYLIFQSDLTQVAAGSMSFSSGSPTASRESIMNTGQYAYLKVFFDTSHSSDYLPVGTIRLTYEEIEQ